MITFFYIYLNKGKGKEKAYNRIGQGVDKDTWKNGAVCFLLIDSTQNVSYETDKDQNGKSLKVTS